MVTGSYLSIITLNVNGLNAPTKGKDWLNGYKNKTPLYAAYFWSLVGSIYRDLVFASVQPVFAFGWGIQPIYV